MKIILDHSCKNWIFPILMNALTIREKYVFPKTLLISTYENVPFVGYIFHFLSPCTVLRLKIPQIYTMSIANDYFIYIYYKNSLLMFKCMGNKIFVKRNISKIYSGTWLPLTKWPTDTFGGLKGRIICMFCCMYENLKNKMNYFWAYLRTPSFLWNTKFGHILVPKTKHNSPVTSVISCSNQIYLASKINIASSAAAAKIPAFSTREAVAIA